MSTRLPPVAISAEFLAQELDATRKALNETLRLQQKQQHHAAPSDFNKEEDYGYDQEVDWSKESTVSKYQEQPKAVQLAKLHQSTNVLVLEQSVVEWLGQAPKTYSDKNEHEEIISPSLLLAQQCEWCGKLAHILVEHSPLFEMGISKLYKETYMPIYKYLYHSLLTVLRRELQVYGYPVHCHELLQQCQSSPDSCPFGLACQRLIRLVKSYQEVLETLEGKQLPLQEEQPVMIVVRELMRPIVQRVRFHFVEESRERMTSTRIDRLPEWLLGYLKEHVLEDNNKKNGSPFQLIRHGISLLLSAEDAQNLEIAFWKELIQLIQWVLTERNYFQHAQISGPRSNPLLLYNAMEQFLLFDRQLRELAPSTSGEGDTPLLGLMDMLVMSKKELRQWWIERERESVFSTLFDEDSVANVPKPLANHVSPRAEIFCALIRSVQWKASTLTSPGFYLQHVAVPLCSQFVDALHETATDLRNLLAPTSNSRNAKFASTNLVSNIHEWIEIINGTHLAANVLLKSGAWQDGMPKSSQSDHDLARFGRSLERLVQVLIEELSAMFVETVLMERAKMASYIMMASHLLSSQDWDGDDGVLSAELKEAHGVLLQLRQVCRSILKVSEEEEEDAYHSTEVSNGHIAHFAPREIWAQVVDRVADKFLEVVLDIQSTTPDIWQAGAKVFARDVDVVVGKYTDVPLVMRLLDVTRLLVLDAGAVQGLTAALGGLVGATTFLDFHDFSSDETVYDEAVFMLKAKGFAHIELKDAVSILNRRRD